MLLKYGYITMLLILSINIMGQSVGGNVYEEKKPVSLVNIMLLKLKDSTLEKAVISDSAGHFLFEKIRAGSYLLTASKVGYQNRYISSVIIENNSTHLELAPIMMVTAAKQLNEVTVNAKRPFIEQKIDRMVVNVGGSIIASGGTALSVLEKSPGISIDQQNDQILFKGKEGVIVQIDGRQTYLAMSDVVSMLRNMPSENIDRIELITNPSARYDAAGNSGIIDIRLKKNNNVGTNGIVSGVFGSGRYGHQRANLQINNRSRKVNLFGSFGISRDGTYKNFELDRDQQDGNGRNFVSQRSPIHLHNNVQNVKAGLDYFISKKTTVGVVWTGLWDHGTESSPAGASFRKTATGPVYLQTLTDKTIDNRQSNQLLNANIVIGAGTKSQLTADVDFGIFRRTFYNSLITHIIIPDSSSSQISGLLSYMPTRIDIFSFKTDYSRSIGKWKLESGVKTSVVKSDNNLGLSKGEPGNIKLDSALSNHFKYAEKVFAGYFTFSGKLDPKTDLLLGARAEYTWSEGNSITLHNVVRKNYLNLFPSIFLTRAIHKNHTLNFSYSYRIDRPNYQSLNPARSYLDPYAYSAGNPFLMPQFTHSLEFKHGFKNKIFTSLGASFTKELAFFLVTPTDSKSTQRMPENIGKSQFYNLVVGLPLTPVKGWNMQTTLSGVYGLFHYRYKQIPLRSEQFSVRLNNSNVFLFGKGWTGELSGRISSPSVNAITRIPWLGFVDIGFQKAFLTNWKAKLSLQDVFHTNHFIGDTRAPEYNNHGLITNDSRIVLLTVSFAFGNQQLKSARQRKTASDEELQRTN